jgi:hypothetical protein
MPLWKKFWLLFTVIWIVVAGLNVLTIIAFSDEVEHGKAVQPAFYGIGVPAALYLALWAWSRFKNRNNRKNRNSSKNPAI